MSLVSEIGRVESRCDFSHTWIIVSVEDLLAHGAVRRGGVYTLKSLGQGFTDLRSHARGRGYAASLGYRTKSYVSRLASSLSRMNIRYIVQVTGSRRLPDRSSDPGRSFYDVSEVVKDRWPGYDGDLTEPRRREGLRVQTPRRES